jgi:hypothetical protein
MTIGIAAWLLIAGNLASSQEPAGPADSRAAHRARMRELASTFQVFATADEPQSKVELVAEPVLRYADSTRQTLESSLWIWGGKGRPSAVMAIEFYPDRQQGERWLYEIASLSTERIAVRRGEDWQWTAKEPGLDLKEITPADPPASRPATRLAQMKGIRDRFTAYERATVEGRIELRPLASPLHRYADEAGGIADGAIFSFASGTNPQVLLVIEARQAAGKSTWKYGLVQLTGEEVVAQLDGQEVWKREGANPPAVRASYVNGYVSLEPSAR